MWKCVRIHEGEISIKGCVAFLKRVTRSLCYVLNHSVNSYSKITFGKGTQLHVLPSKCYSCEFLILTPIELKMFLVWVGKVS